MRLVSRVKEWVEYRRDIRRTRREYRDVRQSQVDHAESERSRSEQEPLLPPCRRTRGGARRPGAEGHRVSGRRRALDPSRDSIDRAGVERTRAF